MTSTSSASFTGSFLNTSGDKKALGIVLTARQITELFALRANVNKDSWVLDICAGTGGFLISAMHQTSKTAITGADKTRSRKKDLLALNSYLICSP